MRVCDIDIIKCTAIADEFTTTNVHAGKRIAVESEHSVGSPGEEDNSCILGRSSKKRK